MPTLPPQPCDRPPDLLGIWMAAMELLGLHDDARKAHSLPLLEYRSELVGAAFDQARDCARRSLLTHAGSDGSNVGDRLTRRGLKWIGAAENAAEQWPSPPGWPDARTMELAFHLWLNSPGHHANIIGPYRFFGAAYSDDLAGRRFWVATFAS